MNYFKDIWTLKIKMFISVNEIVSLLHFHKTVSSEHPAISEPVTGLSRGNEESAQAIKYLLWFNSMATLSWVSISFSIVLGIVVYGNDFEKKQRCQVFTFMVQFYCYNSGAPNEDIDQNHLT